MTIYRNRKQVKAYKRHLKYVEPPEAGCSFCAINEKSPQLIKITANFKIIHNIFPYSMWDSQPVEDHLLILPKIHTDTLADLSPDAAQEFIQIISSYETMGYSVYARAPGSKTKTIIHQHTHLFKPKNKHVKFLFYIKKPHTRYIIS